MGTPLSSRDRVRRAIARKEPDRVPVMDAPWQATIKRWRREGLPEDVSPEDFFDYDIRAIEADLSPRFPVRTIREDDEYITRTTTWGGIRRDHKDLSTTPEVVECPVKRKEDWAPLAKRLEPDCARVDWVTALANYRRWREEGRYIVFGGAAGYDCMQSIIRSEQLLLFMAKEPEWIRSIAMTLARLVVATFEMMWEKGFEFDGLWVYNDMGYRNASLFSPEMYREIIQPGDRLIFEAAHRRGAQAILHSCGRVSGLIPDLLDAGLDCLQPLEVKAGMDPIALKREYGDRLALFGGIDTRLLEVPDLGAFEEEVRTKFAACMPGGGYLYHTDHSVPNDVGFERYSRAMEIVRRYGDYT